MGRLSPSSEGKALYTIEQRQRRDSSPWTAVQGFLAAFQFLVFLASLALVIRTLITGEGAFLANASVLFKTLVLYTIMVTGSLWRREWEALGVFTMRRLRACVGRHLGRELASSIHAYHIGRPKKGRSSVPFEGELKGKL